MGSRPRQSGLKMSMDDVQTRRPSTTTSVNITPPPQLVLLKPKKSKSNKNKAPNIINMPLQGETSIPEIPLPQSSTTQVAFISSVDGSNPWINKTSEYYGLA